ncbi:MAG: NAD(P)/FAD-dependent oxidoreductase [Candidatus Dormibacteraceae bacterium]
MSDPGLFRGPRDVAVVGGGIAGCTVAYELARRGARVILLEQRVLAGAASGRNMGLLLNQVESEVVRIMHRSLDVYRELDDGPVDFHLRRHQQLLLARDESQLGSTHRRARALAALGVRARLLNAQEVRERVPGLALDAAGGELLEDAWALDPAAATRAFAEAARSAGAAIRTHVRVSEVRVRSGRVEGLLTDDGPLAVDLVVIASGPWIRDLAPTVPVSTGRGWLLRTDTLGFELPWIVEEMSWPDQDQLGRAARFPTLSEVAAGDHDRPAVGAFVIAPLPAGDALVGTSLSPSLREAVEGVDMPRQIAARALAAAPGLASAPIVAAWYGMRPMTPDGMPLAGTLEPAGLHVHGGHGSIGMMTAPATARWLADAICGADPAPELAALAPARFPA